jgi:dTDP-4-amino-4,6-dideoxygalactose transaminase
MYIPAWSPLNPNVFLTKSQTPAHMPYPLAERDAANFYLARAGVYALFSTLRKHGVDTVLVPDYHGGNEVRAIRAAGMRVIFFSVNHLLRPDLDELSQLMRDSRVGAVYIIHYMGWPQPVEEILSLCARRGILVIEDCSLSLLSRLGTRPLGAFGDYSVFSLYQTLPLPNGGMVVQNRQDLPHLSVTTPTRCSTISVLGRSSELVLTWVRLRSERLGAALFGLKGIVGRGLTVANIERTQVGHTGFDVSKADLGMSSIGQFLMRRFDYPRILEHRRRNFLLLAERLRGAVPLVRDDLEEGVCPLFCPILVADKHKAAKALQSEGVEAVEFWNHGDPQAEARITGAAPFLRRHVLALPIHQDISPERVHYIADRVLAAVS